MCRWMHRLRDAESMSVLSCLVDTASLSIAELSAVRLDGDLRECGGAFLALDEPDLPAARAQAVRSLAPDGPLLVEHLSAAWVHGFIPTPPTIGRFAVSMAERGKVKPPLPFQLREVVISAAEVQLIGGVPVTTPERTCLDLLRDADLADAVAISIVAECVRRGLTQYEPLAMRLSHAFRLPRKALAQRRLAATATATATATDGAPRDTRAADPMRSR